MALVIVSVDFSNIIVQRMLAPCLSFPCHSRTDKRKATCLEGSQDLVSGGLELNPSPAGVCPLVYKLGGGLSTFSCCPRLFEEMV